MRERNFDVIGQKDITLEKNYLKKKSDLNEIRCTYYQSFIN